MWQKKKKGEGKKVTEKPVRGSSGWVKGGWTCNQKGMSLFTPQVNCILGEKKKKLA